jgi:hypothetical protein
LGFMALVSASLFVLTTLFSIMLIKRVCHCFAPYRLDDLTHNGGMLLLSLLLFMLLLLLLLLLAVCVLEGARRIPSCWDTGV